MGRNVFDLFLARPLGHRNLMQRITAESIHHVPIGDSAIVKLREGIDHQPDVGDKGMDVLRKVHRYRVFWTKLASFSIFNTVQDGTAERL